jgi:TonB family protein
MLRLVVAAMLAQALPPQGPPLASSAITAPDWLSRPDGDDLAKYYPDLAARKHLEGFVTIHCSITTEGRLADCAVTEESPAGVGFGEAALKLSRLFTMRPMTRDGRPTSVGTINLPIRFGLPADHVFSAAIRIVDPEAVEGRVEVSCWVAGSRDLEDCTAFPIAGRKDLEEVALKAAARFKAPIEVQAGANMVLKVHVAPSR